MLKRSSMRLLALFISGVAMLPALAADELFLEGISILGKQRSALLSLNGKQVSVQPGEEVGEWQVVKIEARAIFLKSTKDPQATELELALHSRLGETPPAPVAGENPPTAPVTDAPVPASAASPPGTPRDPMPPEQAAPITQTAPIFQPRMIKDEDIPPGHRRVRTPFGDVLVKEQAAQ